MAEFLLNHIDICISLVFFAVFAVIFAVKVRLIFSIKKEICAENKNSDDIKITFKYVASLVLAALFIVLSAFIGFKWFYSLIFCGAAVAAETAVFNERIEMLKNINKG